MSDKQRVAVECNRLGALVADLQQQLAEARKRIAELEGENEGLHHDAQYPRD